MQIDAGCYPTSSPSEIHCLKQIERPMPPVGLGCIVPEGIRQAGRIQVSESNFRRLGLFNFDIRIFKLFASQS